MKTFISLLRIDMRRAIFSSRFWLAALGVVCILRFATIGLSTSSDVIAFLNLGFSTSGTNTIIIFILPIIPYAMTFASEWTSHATNFWVVRTGVTPYAASKFIAGVLSGFLMMTVGVLIFVLLMCLRRPFFISSATGDALSPLLDAGRPLLYTCFFTLSYSLSSALFAAAAVLSSALLPHAYTALIAPSVLYFIINRITMGAPSYLDIVTLVQSHFQTGSPFTSILYKLFLVALLCLLMGWGTVRLVQRRVSHD